MVWQRWANTGLDSLPVILAGPILRRAMPDAVTVWVALKTACNVSLEVTGGGASLTGSAPTIRLANHLHVAAVTATGAALPRNRVYQYNIELSGGAAGTLLTPGILSKGTIGPASVGPGGSGLPSFALPPVDLEQLRIVHGSCRKAHGEGRDPTVAFDAVIAATASSHENRPHMLFLTGDQIYGDDVADRMLVMLQDAGDALGFAIENPQLPTGITVLPTAGLRNPLMKQIGITAGDAAKSHLIRFSEYACMYLFAWSEVLWQGNELPTLLDTYDTGEFTDADRSAFDREGVRMLIFSRSLPAIRRVLANIPTYMIFDDHEVTDDWFLDRLWVDRASADPLFRRIVQNGLAAYAAFQGWGNDPNELQANKGGSTLLASLNTWSQNPNNTAQSEDLSARLGLPIGSPGTQAYVRHANAVDWHYSYVDPALPFRVAVLDTRTRRQYGPGAHSAPGLIAPAELANQLGPVASVSSDGEELILIVSPSPIVGYPLVEKVQQLASSVAAYFPDPEFWTRHPTSFHRMLAALGATNAGALRRIVVLSGDVHYAFTSALRYRVTTPIGQTTPAQADASFVQLTCSSQKNQEAKTRGLHTANLMAAPAMTYGWNNPGGGPVVIGQLFDPSTGMFHNVKKSGNPIIFDAIDFFYPFAPTDPLPTGGRVPDWSTACIFFKSTADRPATLPTPVPPGATQLQDHLAVLRGHQTYQTQVAGGSVVVGRTNVGQLTLRWGANNDKFVTHELFWFGSGSNDPGMLSAFTARLDLS